MTVASPRVMLLLGSGVSLPTGLPRTEQVTRALLEEEWWRHSNGQFIPGPEPNPDLTGRITALRIQPFLKLLKERADTYLHERGLPPSNYEDVYFLAWQLAEEAGLSRLNPALAPFFEEIKLACVQWVQPLPLTEKEFTFERLTSEACHFMECVVRRKLWTRNPPRGFNLVLDLARQFAVPGFTIATLNHDTLVEGILSDAGIGFADGFLPPDGDVAFFEPSLLDNSHGIKLLKLHGSINWKWTRVKENGEWRDCYTKIVGGQPWQRRTQSGIRIEHELPAGMLVGTLNKLFDYHFGITQEVLLRFHRTLRATDTLIISGYGWGDFAVNGWLKSWLGVSPGHRIILLHRNPEAAVRDHAGSHIFPWEYKGWERDGRLVLIQKWLCETSMEELLPILGKPPERTGSEAPASGQKIEC